MAKIISRGSKNQKITRHTCQACGSVVEYTNEDEKKDYIEMKYVVCPACQEITYSNNITWRSPGEPK